MATAAASVPAWSATTRSANEQLSIAIIGSGDRAGAHIRELLSLREKRNVSITVVCDVWKKNRESAASLIAKTSGRAPKQFTRYEEVLAQKDVDAVLIATPDFSHGTILNAALDAGKDVYIEKPMTIDVASANRALDVARAKKLVVQAGTQRRSEGNFIAASKLISSGAIGKVNRITAAMNVNAPRWTRRVDDCVAPDVDWPAFTLGKLKHDFDPRLLRCWQLFRATSNGIPGLWMTHYADAVHMLTGAKYPIAAVSLGGNYVWQDGREHVDTFHTVLEYPDGFFFAWSMGLGNSAGVHFTLHGTKGTLDAEKWICSNEGGAGVKTSEVVANKISPERGESHIENWLTCIRSRAKPNADIEFGHQHVVATVMAASALETGKRQRWDTAKREIICA